MGHDYQKTLASIQGLIDIFEHDLVSINSDYGVALLNGDTVKCEMCKKAFSDTSYSISELKLALSTIEKLSSGA